MIGAGTDMQGTALHMKEKIGDQVHDAAVQDERPANWRLHLG